MDDEIIIRETMNFMMHDLGYAVILAETGRQALSFMWQSLASGNYFTAIILDLLVPGGMGGRETAQEIRKIDKHIPIFAMSGYSDEPAIQSPTDFGFTASICKPFRKKDLADLLEKHVKKSER